MRHFHDLSIRQQLFRTTVVTVGLALLLACAAFVAYDLLTFRAGLARDLATLAEVIGTNSTASVAFNDPKSAGEVLSALRAKPRIVRAFIYTTKGRPFATYYRAGEPHVVPAAPPGDGQWVVGHDLTLARGIVLAGERVGSVVVHSDLQEARTRLASFGGIMAGVFGASMLVTLLVSVRMQRVISAPILHLAQVARGISMDRNYDARAVPRGGDEARLLIDAFNQMLDQIQVRDGELESQRLDLKVEVEKRTSMNAQLETAWLKAEEANRIKSEFLANVSHEIRTPMNGILGLTELALNTDLTPEQREYLGMAHLSADSLLTVINAILDFSKIEAGRLELDLVEFSLRHELDAIMRTAALRAHEKGLELVCDIAPDVPQTLVGDSSRLRQVVVNLVGNAIKFTEVGEIVVRVAGVSIARDQARLRFSVTDSGIGIPLDKQALIFEPFTQADGSTTRRYGGTGLGLTISSRLTEMMGGRLEVESLPGQGSTFSFTAVFGVPHAPVPQTASAVALKGPHVGVVDNNRAVSPSNDRPAPPVVPAAPLRILVAEDNVVNQRLMLRLLERRGHAVTMAPTGVEAVAACQRMSFDIVLMDVQMPEMGGLEATAAIRQREQAIGGHVPIVAMTAHAMKGDRERCLEAGMDGYLTKPVKTSELDAVLNTVAAGVDAASSALTVAPPG